MKELEFMEYEDDELYSKGRVDGFKRGYDSGHKMGYEKARTKKAGVWFLLGWIAATAVYLIPMAMR